MLEATVRNINNYYTKDMIGKEVRFENRQVGIVDDVNEEYTHLILTDEDFINNIVTKPHEDFSFELR